MTNQQEGLWEVELLNDGVFTITSTAIEAEGTVFTYLVF
jgi:hypothetical protein